MNIEIIDKAFALFLGLGAAAGAALVIAFIALLIAYAAKGSGAPGKNRAAPAGVPAPFRSPAPQGPDTELAAVIAAAITAYRGEGAPRIVVRSIRRVR